MQYYVKVEPNVNIFINDVNENGYKTILFIHGWPVNQNMFEYQFNVLPKLGYRCIGMDLRGFGKSDKPWNGYSYDRLADDILAVVDVLKLKNFTLLGFSVGGPIVIKYMSRHNGYGVSKLILCAPAAPSFVQGPDFSYGQTKETVDNLIQGTYNDRPKMLHDFGNTFFYQYISQPFSDWFFQMGLMASGNATAKLAITLRDENVFSDLKKIFVPTLILHGIHDKICFFDLGKVLNKEIKDSKLIPFEDSGHGLFWEEREKFNNEINKFIDS